ncbi:MAG: sigma-70 family RNA polymerase sigma factor [Colwellia sp.]|nr:sigma-70 family RNA polymerase sigma factor [Colwellia sp.]
MITQIWHDFHQQLLVFIKSKVSNQDIAEDILQDTFIRVQKNIATLHEPNKLTSWLYQICRNVIIDYYRKQTLNIDDIDVNELTNETNIELDRIKLNSCINLLINDIDESYKDILVAYEINCLKQKDIAQHFNLSLPAVKSRIKRGRHQLKEKLIYCCDFNFNENNITHECKVDCSCN